MILWQSLLYFIYIIYTSCWHRELAPADLQPVSTDDRGRYTDTLQHHSTYTYTYTYYRALRV